MRRLALISIRLSAMSFWMVPCSAMSLCSKTTTQRQQHNNTQRNVTHVSLHNHKRERAAAAAAATAAQ
jgi:hypothetical protein